MVYKITDSHSKPRKIKINSFMQWIKVGRICKSKTRLKKVKGSVNQGKYTYSDIFDHFEAPWIVQVVS